jgi:hypothetical protein
MCSVEVFRTTVPDHAGASVICGVIRERFPAWVVNFDLDDCDRVLRIKGEGISASLIIDCVRANGFECEMLE